MSRNKVMLVAVAMAGFLFAVSVQAANDSTKPVKEKQITVIGKVHETKDKKGNLEKVKIVTSKDKTYHVTLDAKGEELGKTMAGKHVEATGTVSMKDKEHWLAVEKYTEHTPKK